jgi:hypothetical protein
MKNRTDRRLVSIADAKLMAKKKAPASDWDDVIVLTYGRLATTRAPVPSLLDRSRRRRAVASPAPSSTPPDAERLLRFILSNSQEDRSHDTIDVAGWDLKNYLLNPVMLWSHIHEEPPIGRATEVGVVGDNLMATAQFVPLSLSPFAETIYQLYLAKFLSAVSVGFQPSEYTYNDDSDGMNFLQQELVEFSGCAVPCLPSALVQLSAKGADVRPFVRWAENILDLEGEPAHASTMSRRQLDRLRVQANGGRSVFSVLRSLTLPKTTKAPASPDTATEIQEQIRQPLITIGTTLSIAMSEVNAALQPAGVPPGEDPSAPAPVDPDATVVQHLTTARNYCLEAYTGLGAVGPAIDGIVSALGGTAPKHAARTLTKADRIQAKARLVMLVGKLARSGARHNEQDRADLQAIHDLCIKLGATCTVPPVETDEDEELMLDGAPLIDDEDPLRDFSIDDLDPKDVARVIADVVAEQLCKVTGDLGPR